MPERRVRFRQATVAVLAALALLVVSGASVLPGHWHNGPQGPNCEVGYTRAATFNGKSGDPWREVDSCWQASMNGWEPFS